MITFAHDGSPGTGEVLGFVKSHLDLIKSLRTARDYVLELTDRLTLTDRADPKRSFFIDLLGGREMRRILHTGKNSEALLRAVSHKGSLKGLRVSDASAGLGRDSMLLQSAGAQVSMHERNPVVYALLMDALRRAGQDPRLKSLPNGLPRLMEFGDFSGADEGCDVIYYDPMFPARTKSALVRKDMQFFHAVVGEDADQEVVVGMLCEQDVRKVVVKRPRGAGPAWGVPGYSVHGGLCRFDCYVL